MAIVVTVGQPALFLTDLRKAIDAGTIKQWRYDGDGDFIHVGEKRLAWLRPVVGTDVLTLKILGEKDRHMTRATYASYHAAFLEMLLTHFDEKFQAARITALPIAGEYVGPAVRKKTTAEA